MNPLDPDPQHCWKDHLPRVLFALSCQIQLSKQDIAVELSNPYLAHSGFLCPTLLSCALLTQACSFRLCKPYTAKRVL